MCSNSTWCYGSSGVLGAWASATGHTEQAQLVGAAECNRPELLEYLAAYYSLVLMAITFCLNGPGGQILNGPGGQVQLQPASPLSLINQPRLQSMVSV